MMPTRFGLILDILDEAFRTLVSEKDYYEIVDILQEYSDNRDDVSIEQQELKQKGWPLTYHPCDHMQRLRFAMTFGESDNVRIRELLYCE